MSAAQPRPRALVAAVVTLVMGGASGGCDRDARPIRNEFQALFDERPVVTVVPCPDGEQATRPSAQQCLRGDGSDRSKQTATLASVYLGEAEATDVVEIYRAFHDALAPLRPRVMERWGKPIADTLASCWTLRARREA